MRTVAKCGQPARPMMRRLITGQASGQALVEFAMVLILILTILTGGVIVIRALFLEQSLIDVATRAVQWGASTNSNEEMQKIINEAYSFAPVVNVTIDPPDAAHRPIGTLLTLTLHASVPLVGVQIALNAPLSAQVAAVVEHNPMRFVEPKPPPIALRIGDVVQGHTTRGDNLNVRRKPGLDGDVYFVLRNGGQATIVDGPVDANGLRWWKITLPKSKLSGWCVDRADQLNTLILIASTF